MKKTAAIYPYQYNLYHMFRYQDEVPYDMKVPISRKGFSLDGRDAKPDGTSGIIVNSNFTEGIKDVDTVIFHSSDADAIDKIEIAMELGKNIVLLKPLEQKVLVQLQKKCEDRNLELHTAFIETEQFKDTMERELFNMEVPVILVCGMADTTNKFDIQLSIRHYMKKSGYKISQISSKRYGTFYGMHNFPVYMYDANPEYEKILYFNHYIKQIEIKEKPDVIIIGVPGGIIPLDRKFNNQFSWLMYLISNAVSFDTAIFSMTFHSYEENFITYMNNFCKYRYGFQISQFHLSDIYHDLTDNGNMNLKQYMRVTAAKYKEEYEKYSGQYCNIRDEKSAEKLTLDIIDELSNNIS